MDPWRFSHLVVDCRAVSVILPSLWSLSTIKHGSFLAQMKNILKSVQALCLYVLYPIAVGAKASHEYQQQYINPRRKGQATTFLAQNGLVLLVCQRVSDIIMYLLFQCRFRTFCLIFRRNQISLSRLLVHTLAITVCAGYYRQIARKIKGFTKDLSCFEA